MKIPNQLPTALLLGLTVLFSSSLAHAGRPSKTGDESVQSPSATLLIEDFTAAAGTALTSAGWSAHSAGGTNAIVTSAPSLTLAGYPSSGVGNAVTLTTSGEDDNRTFPVQSSGSVYAAFMVTVSEASTDPAGGYFFHLGPDPVGTTFRGRVFIKKDASNNIAFGISKALTTSTDIVFTPFNYSLNTTYLIVVKYTIVAGVTNDTVSLFVSTTVPVAEPAPTVTATDTTQTDISPGTVSLRQGTATTSPTVRVDGIRVGTDWASATQAVTPADAPLDFNGDGKTDYAVARNNAGQLRWFWSLNGGGGNGEMDWGVIGDTVVMEDFDGDGKDDVTVWRQAVGVGSAFYIFQSQTSTIRITQFGLIGDDATVVGDYDGDGKADEAVYRPGAAVGQQSTWFFKGSLNNPSGNITYVPWGINGDRVAPGDYDGDGKNDFVVRRDVGSNGVWWERLATGTIPAPQTFGLTTDRIIPGDYDGDGKTDLTAQRADGGPMQWFYLPSSGGAFQQITWGNSNDTTAQGDYDGDGKTDVAVWKAGPPSQFLARSSQTGDYVLVLWGGSNDLVIANFNRH